MRITIPVLLIELIESELEHDVDILSYINVYVLLLLTAYNLTSCIDIYRK